MEEDKVVESIPTETMESDDDFFAEVDEEVMKEESAEENESDEAEESEETEESEPSETEESKDEVDFTPLLKALSGKIKYNKEEVNVDSIEDLITGYQKGLNYDKKVQELENLQNSKLEKYAKSKADELGISVEEYMDRVEKYEQEQKKAQEEQELEEMIENGVPDSLAREILAGRQLRFEYQQMKNEMKEWKESTQKEEEKNKKYQEFLNKFPDVNPEDIPKEVFEEAENSSLSEAYMKWQLGELKKQLEVAKTNEKNANSAIGSVTSTGTTNKKHSKDPFLEGFLDE
jgi:hypothetical protein